MGQLRRCPVVSAEALSKNMLGLKRSTEEAGVAGTASERMIEPGVEVREAGRPDWIGP